MDRIRIVRPDVVLMDIDMPYVDLIAWLTLLKEAFPDLKVIMQIIFEVEVKIVTAICAGADGYILRQKSPLQLIDGSNEVLQGGAPMTPSIALKLQVSSKTEAVSNALRERLV